MSAVEKRLALKKLLVLIALLRRRIQRQKQIQEKILAQTDFFKNRMKKDNLKISFRLRSNKPTLLV